MSVWHRKSVEDVHRLGAFLRTTGPRRTEAVGVDRAPPQRPCLGVVRKLGVILRLFPHVARKGIRPFNDHFVQPCVCPFGNVRGRQVVHYRLAQNSRKSAATRRRALARASVHARFRVGHAHRGHPLRRAHRVFHRVSCSLGIIGPGGRLGLKVFQGLAEDRLRRLQTTFAWVFEAVLGSLNLQRKTKIKRKEEI